MSHPMSRPVIRAAALLALLAASASPAAHPDVPSTTPAPAQSTAPPLPAWEQLTPGQREQLTATIRDRWNDAAPAERARMLARAERWQQMGTVQRERISRVMGRWQGLPPGDHQELRALFHALGGMGEAERADFLKRWEGMNAEERKAWGEANPPPPRGNGPRHRPHPPGREHAGHRRGDGEDGKR